MDAYERVDAYHQIAADLRRLVIGEPDPEIPCAAILVVLRGVDPDRVLKGLATLCDTQQDDYGWPDPWT